MGFGVVGSGVVGSGVVGSGVVGFGVVGFGVVGFGVVGFGVIGSTQTSTPSAQLCSNFGLPGAPHLPSQDPPFAQQVRLPFFTTHFKHTGV